jgi:hypothetical protein
MNLYLDDDSASSLLATLLTKAGHQVTIPADVNLSGASDPRHLFHAVQFSLTLLTRNHDDFEDLHNLVRISGGQHPGILVVRLDNDPTRDLKERDIVRAIANLTNAGVPIASEVHILNHWR